MKGPRVGGVSERALVVWARAIGQRVGGVSERALVVWMSDRTEGGRGE